MSLKLEPSDNIGRLVLIDGDEVIWKCSYSCEQSSYTVYDTSGRELFNERYKRDVNSGLKELELTTDQVVIDKEVIVWPIDRAIEHVKTFISSILSELQTPRYVIYLAEGENFRNNVATLKPYKGNRPANKPHHYNAVREYITDNENVSVVTGIETDDGLGIHHYKSFLEAGQNPLKCDTILCSQDKDLRMIPGWNYNPNTKDLRWISYNEAENNFWNQVLTGDIADNIPGITGIGSVKAKKILQGYYDRDELYALVYHEYYEYYGGDDERAYKHIEEIAKLLWIMREHGVTWNGQNVCC